MGTNAIQMLSLGNNIKKARERAGFTQDQLAEQIGVSRTAIARYEAGEIEPRLKNLIAIAECLNVSTDHLLGIETDEGCPEWRVRLSQKAEEALEVLVAELKMYTKIK